MTQRLAGQVRWVHDALNESWSLETYQGDVYMLPAQPIMEVINLGAKPDMRISINCTRSLLDQDRKCLLIGKARNEKSPAERK